MKLSDYVIRFVADQGVKHVFLVTGGGAMHLNESLGRAPRSSRSATRTSRPAPSRAEDYAKATNNLGVALVTTGPGGTNAVTGVAGAWLDSTPCSFVSGQVKRPDRMFDADGKPLGHAPAGRSGSRHRFHRQADHQIRRHGSRPDDHSLSPGEGRLSCARTAVPGRSGSIFRSTCRRRPSTIRSSLRGFDPAELRTSRAGPRLKTEVQQMIEALNRPERPLLFAGNGIRLAQAEREFRAAAQAAEHSVAATWCAADLVPSDDPLYVGRPGSRGRARGKLRAAELRFSTGHRRTPGLCHHRLCAREARPRGP